MISGFNTNVRYRGILFHVQTEDSGRRRPHVITHLYCEGVILASEKSEYAERLGSPRLEEEVRALMERQHREMVERLRGGALDPVIEERLGLDWGATSPPTAPSPGGIAQPSPSRAATERLRGPAAPPAAARVAPRSPSARAESVLPEGEKPLDEVILEYLIESARKRKQRPR